MCCRSLLFALLMLPATMRAQQHDAVKLHYDTAFIHSNYDAFILRALTTVKLSFLVFNTPDPVFDGVVLGSLQQTVGADIGWKWLGLGYSFSIPTLDYKPNTDITFNIYGLKYGIDVAYHDYNDYQLENAFDPDTVLADTVKLPFISDMSNRKFFANAYWVFNNKRFAFPSTFSNTYMQRRSAGSFIAGLSHTRTRISFTGADSIPDFTVNDTLKVDRLDMIGVSLHFGYAYNAVVRKHFIVHISMIPGFAVKQTHTVNSHIAYDAERSYLGVDVNFRLGMVYLWRKLLVGLNITAMDQWLSTEVFDLNDTFGFGQFYVGWIFGGKQEAR